VAPTGQFCIHGHPAEIWCHECFKDRLLEERNILWKRRTALHNQILGIELAIVTIGDESLALDGDAAKMGGRGDGSRPPDPALANRQEGP
jgi:hypothetical protein